MAFMRGATKSWVPAVALLGVLFCGSLVVMSVLNWGVAEFARTPGSLDGTLSIRPPFKIRAPILQISPAVRIDVPLRLRVGEARRLSVEIRKAVYLGEEPTGAISSADIQPWSEVQQRFEIQVKPSEALRLAGEQNLVQGEFEEPTRPMFEAIPWHWTLSVSEPGSHLLLVEGLPLEDSGEFTFVGSTGVRRSGKVDDLRADPVSPEGYRMLRDGTLEFRIIGLTELGLTRTQHASLRAVAVLIGAIATVFSYPFWKRVLKHPKSETTSSIRREELILPGDISAKELERYSRESQARSGSQLPRD